MHSKMGSNLRNSELEILGMTDKKEEIDEYDDTDDASEDKDVINE